MSRSASFSFPSARSEPIPKSCLRRQSADPLNLAPSFAPPKPCDDLRKSVSFCERIDVVEQQTPIPSSSSSTAFDFTSSSSSQSIMLKSRQISHILQVLRVTMCFVRDSVRRSVYLVAILLAMRVSGTRSGKKLWGAARFGIWGVRKVAGFLPKSLLSFVP
eukprot:c8735_g1_i1.p1 GENE.c8735_g1_i1~~c8735_g1_i1.p1  ORF type:complete len:161 (+),score=23.38 c8735_g1_i1:450-932(+)